MNQKTPVRPSSGISLGDIYYILFKHKRKIALISAVGILAALALPLVWRLPYQSEAKLFIRYVLESKSLGQVGASDTRVKSPDERGESIMNTELEILTSLDLAQVVAKNIGPEKILAKAGVGKDPYRAAAFIHANLLAESPKRSCVIRLLFQHPDPEIAPLVLNQLKDSYLLKHAEIHRTTGVIDETLNRETDDLKSRLLLTEEELRQAKAKVNLVSLEESKKLYAEQSSKIQQAISDTGSELAERQASVNEMARLLHPKSYETTNDLATASDPAATNDVAVPAEKLAQYRRVSSLLETLGKKEQELLLQFTPVTTVVRAVQDQITFNEKLKKKLVEEYPGLLTASVPESKSAPGDSVSAPRIDVLAEKARVAALQAKIRFLTNQLQIVLTNATKISEAEVAITDLQRRRELEEANYKYFAATKEQSRIDTELGVGRVSNIATIQAPSAPFRDGTKLQKVQAFALFGSIAFALALAFVIELYLDRSLKRPLEIEARLGVPLFLSIPLLGTNGATRRLKWLPKKSLPPARNGSYARAAESNGHGEASADSTSGLPAEVISAPLPNGFNHHGLSDANHYLRPFYETLRDRLIAFFEAKNLTHKPKLVAVTGCGGGAGVTTIAAGLAASLSETGDGNVLLVDMNVHHGAAHHFYKGNLDCGLDDALETGKRGGALVQENLYVVAEATNGDSLPRALPRRFTHLVPKLKTSDYDYIIFDMPPVTQISVTPRLAQFMDIVLLVVESEKTDRDVVKRAANLLSASTANVGAILNKRRTYVPKSLLQEM